MWLGMGLTDGGMYDHRGVMDNELMMADYTSMMNELSSMPPQMLPPPPPPPPFIQDSRQQPHQPGRNHLSQQRFGNGLPSTRGRRSDANRNGGQSRGRGSKDPQSKSTVNPSKRHRDRLNLELDNLSKLLPFPEDVIARLDKLSILRLSVSYLRNKNFYRGSSTSGQRRGNVTSKDTEKSSAAQSSANQPDSLNKDGQFRKLLNKAIDGFIIVVTVDGELFYVSERVKEYLGYSQSQVLHQQFDTLLHDDEKEEVSNILKTPPSTQVMEVTGDDTPEFPEYDTREKDFVVRLKSALNTNTSDLYKPFRICGSVRRLHMEPDISNLKYALFAICTPARTSCSMLEVRIKTTLFCSKNRIDLSFLDLDARGKEFFGYSKKDIFGRSSYVLVHRQDLQHLRCKHSEIMTCGKTSIGTFRLMSKSDEWAWVCGYARVLYKNGKPDFLVTTNRIMSEEEGQAMMKIRDDADYKALEKIGLIEPDEPEKALRLGFPNRAAAINDTLDILKNEPIPMPLQAFVPPEVPPQYVDEPIDFPKLENDELLPCEKEVNTNSSVLSDNNSSEILQLPTCDLPPPIPMAHSPSGSQISGHTVKSRTSGHSSASAHSHHSGNMNFENPNPQEHWSPFQTSSHSISSKGSIGNGNGIEPMSSSVDSSQMSSTSFENNLAFSKTNDTSTHNYQNYYTDQHTQRHASTTHFQTDFRNTPFGVLPPDTRPSQQQQDFLNMSTYPSIHNIKNDEFDYGTSSDNVVGPNITLNSPQFPNLMNSMQQQMGLQQANMRLPNNGMMQRNFTQCAPFMEGGGWLQNTNQPPILSPSVAQANIPVDTSAQEMLEFLHSQQNIQYTWQ